MNPPCFTITQVNHLTDTFLSALGPFIVALHRGPGFIVVRNLGLITLLVP